MMKRYTGTRSFSVWLVPAVSLALTVAVFVINYLYQTHHFNYTLKCRASMCFAAIGMVNLLWSFFLRRQRPVCTLLALGLVFAMLGDLTINNDFVRGAILFAAGHVLLLLGYCVVHRLRRADLFCSALPAIGGVGFLLFYPYLHFSRPALQTVCLVYAVIISCMLGKAAANFFARPALFTGLQALGSLLFFFSDFMLLLHWFVGRWRWTDNACMATYYPAVCLIALSMCALLVKESGKSRR